MFATAFVESQKVSSSSTKNVAKLDTVEEMTACSLQSVNIYIHAHEKDRMVYLKYKSKIPAMDRPGTKFEG